MNNVFKSENAHQNNDGDKKRSTLTIVNNLIVTSVIILFFLGIIVIYYSMLYNETRDNIIKNGELNAVRASTEIENYIDTGTGVVSMTSYTLDSMLQAGKSNKQIEEFLESQNYAASNVVPDQVNGIYGYINGQFLNGIGWRPYNGYDPTHRPWYKEAIKKAGKVAVVNPYHDARTGSMMVTMSKMLGDAESVVAIDVSVDELQKITEDIAKQGNTDTEIVLDSNYRVIAHSNKDEVGKFYSENDGSFGSAIVKKMLDRPPGTNHFTMKYRKENYIIYTIRIDNDWNCISVTNATAAFDRLIIPLVLTIVVSLLVIAVLLIIMIRSFRKGALAEKMRKIADEQSEMAHVDPMTGLKNRRAYAETLAQLSKSLPPGTKVVVFDLNGLKEANDTYGHEAGDDLIVAAADCIRSSFEGVDDIFRIGGDEFCLITTMDEDQVKACLKKLADVSAAYKGDHINGVSISSGIGTDREHAHIENIVREADKNMYKQKQDYYNMAEHDRRSRH